jgi:hypothetical protein
MPETRGQVVNRPARDEAKAPKRPIANRPQDAILPHFANWQNWHFLDFEWITLFES